MRRFLPSLSALQAFEASARHLNFTRAAEDLSVTQSGISRQITNLEQFLGMRLFERSGSR
ncbi:LysR family transcriptional regulator, partial [Pseudomonas quasicaspiana]|nr:LysR family transcriptional regulator [Pseudomonas quasicaspiana]